ncbi:Uncharacterized protein TPAR_05184 [Tolypocladium paradoxum]|uniref:DNA replication factor Cdt1 C-terminal domain-containing protein n=1 Tax=Tolypocladium paradoxum TaxID=94208 RepID=A0A2S4KWP0_9HYPO|nr:Uncharacterized protein TPAR_05184 [Tolypocladium paradoxum]
MPRRAGKRQAATAHAPAGQTISAFTRVSKGSALPVSSVKKSAVVVATQPAAVRKRKATSIDAEAERRLTRRTVSFPPSSDEDDGAAVAPSKRACRRPEPEPEPEPEPQSPTSVGVRTGLAVKGKRVAKAAPSTAESAHKPCESTIIAKSRRQEKTLQTKLDVVRSKRTTKDSHTQSSFPPHLAELVRLNKAFLKTVAIHLAHTSSGAPIDIRAIAPHISRAWGRRQVTVEDIRRCIAIQACSSKQGTASPLIISDYGRGRVCVELRRGYDAASLHEERLCRQFEENLRALCAERAMDDMADVHVPFQSLSLADLPQAAITDMGAGARANPMLTKGQRALSELKSGIVAKQQQQEAKQAAGANPTLNPDGTKMSLLDRLRHKQLARANEPLPPSGPELQRRAALNRVADVAATISMLSLSNPRSLPRQAFTMAGIVEKLRDSLRVPVSRDEGVACVRLIAAEVAPEWLRVVAIGGRENVVVQRDGQPVDRVIQARVQNLLAA